MINDRNFRNRVLAEVFLHPVVVIPFAVGAFAMFFSFEGPRYLRVLAAGGLFVAFGALFARMTFHFEAIVQSTFKKWTASQERQEKKLLDALEYSFESKKLDRELILLRELRSVYKVFTDTVNDGRIKYEFVDTAQKLFRESVELLKESNKVYDELTSVSKSDLRKPFMVKRAKLLDESQSGLGTLSGALKVAQDIAKHNPTVEHEGKDLSSLRREMDQRLELAKEIERRLSHELNGINDGNVPGSGEG